MTKIEHFKSQLLEWVKNHLPVVYTLFMLIEEPRFKRLMQFGVYAGLAVAGILVLTYPPSSFESVIGVFLAYTLGGFITLGSVLGMIAVLPGTWWLERVGILSISSGLGLYIYIIISLEASPIGNAVSVAFIFTFIQRWSEIKGAALAPKTDFLVKTED